ncbi:MAG: hypothetical protein F6K30_18425 [Cyanothece sp. SIO2G6]|nr:hypothetical protein [Cyanothece sp. SIO2G6]
MIVNYHQDNAISRVRGHGAGRLIGAVLLHGTLMVPPPTVPFTIAQQPTVTQADRAISLITNAAAVWFNTAAGNINVAEFGSRREDDQVLGYDAVVERVGSSQGQLRCQIDLTEVDLTEGDLAEGDLTETVTCQPIGPEDTEAARVEVNSPSEATDAARAEANAPSEATEAARVETSSPSEATEVVRVGASGPCDLARRQETLWEGQFIRSDPLIVSTRADYAVRIYEAINAQTGNRQICMNVYNLLENMLVGDIPIRVSATATAYYSNVSLDGIDHQVLLGQDNVYIYRQSRDKMLLYEGYSR